MSDFFDLVGEKVPPSDGPGLIEAYRAAHLEGHGEETKAFLEYETRSYYGGLMIHVGWKRPREYGIRIAGFRLFIEQVASGISEEQAIKRALTRPGVKI